MTYSKPNFPTTRWALIEKANTDDEEESSQALSVLFEKYWKPAFLFVRQQGFDTPDAEDAVQDFFARIVKSNMRLFREADPARGRFRTYLLGALKRELIDIGRKANAKKRNADQRSQIHLDDLDQHCHNACTPEMLYEQEWARCLIAAACGRLESEDVSGRLTVLLPFILETPDQSYAEAATALGITESATRSNIHRLRHRFYEIVREEVRDTVSDEASVDDEIRHLLQVMASE